MDARSKKGFSSKSPFNREQANNIYGDGKIDMSQTRRPLIAMDGQQVRTLQPGQNAQFQGMVTEMDPDFLFALEGALLEKHLGMLKADQQAEFIEKYEPLPENMKRAALMQMAQMHQDVVQQAMAQEESTPQLKYGGTTTVTERGKYQDGGVYQQIQAPTEGFKFTGITSNRPTKENTVDIARNPQGFRRGTPAGSNGKGTSRAQVPQPAPPAVPDALPQQQVVQQSVQQNVGFNGFVDPAPYSRSTEVIQTVTGRALPTAYMPTTSVDYTPAYSGPHIYKQPVGLNVPVAVSNESVGAPLQSDLRLPNKTAYDTPFQVTERESDQFQHVSTDPQGRWSTYYDPQFKRYLRRERSGMYKRVDKP